VEPERHDWVLEVYPALLRSVQHRTGYDATRALDIVHDAILAIYDSMERFDPQKGNFQAWAAGVLRHTVLRHFEGRGRRERLAPVDELDGQEHPRAGPAVVESVVGEIGGLIQRTLDEVPPLYRDVLRLRYREGRSLKQIARHLRVPIGTVKARLSRATDMLKEGLQFQQTTVRTFLDGRPGRA
jgi:RNA polymerase sigma-70 factor (ECF subfamily)